jgi:curved DNA-binding protein CbpA
VSDPYAVLGVSPCATDEEVRRAYRSAALRCHPDRDPGPGAPERFRAVADAYEILRDPERRRRHDAQRAALAACGAPILKLALEALARQLGGAGSRASWDGDTLTVQGGALRLTIRLAPS